MVDRTTLGAGLVLLAATALALSVGSSGVGAADLLAEFRHWRWDQALSDNGTLLFDVRLPRIVVGGVCGAVLSAAGVLTQGLFRNPLASPSVLGIEAGGALGAAWMFYAANEALHLWSVPLAALGGCVAATLLILTLASKSAHWSVEGLLLMGFGVMAIAGSLTSLTVSLTLEEHQRGTAVMQWMLGSFSGKGWEHLVGILPLMTLGFILAYRASAALDVLSLGGEIAASAGVSMRNLRMLTIASVALLVGGAVATAGAIPFVSLIVPHFTRLMTGPKHGRLMLVSALNGASLMILSDTLARTVRAPSEIEVGLVTALIGTPVFLFLLSTRQSAAEVP